MTALDLDTIREDAEWSSKRMNTTDVAYKVATVHVPVLVAEVKRLRELLDKADATYAARLDATLTGSASPDEATWPGYWEAKRLVLAELDRKSSGSGAGEPKQ